RDLDVAIAGIKKASPGQPHAAPDLQVWQDKRADAQRELARSLKSARYRRLIDHTSAWIDGGGWATKRSRPAAKRRAMPVGSYSADRLAKWENELLRRSCKLRKMGARKRHRLRLLNKRLNYSIESVAELFADKRLSQQKIAMKHLRRAQRSLGQLNDAVRGRALARELRRQGRKGRPHLLRPRTE